MGRAPCCDKANVKRGPWSPDEDAILKSYLERNGTGGNWIALPHKAGLRRCGKSCRLRWLNYLRPDIKHGGFTQEEDYIIITLFKTIGSRWSVIASQLPGRTDNDVKNYWNTKLKKKVLMASASQELPVINPSISSTQEITPMFPPLLQNPKIEDNFIDWAGLFSGLNPLPLYTGLISQPDQICTTTPENSSAASSSVDNWSTNGSSRDDDFLYEMGFGSYSELISGYGQYL